MKCDVGGLLEAAQIDHAHDESGYTENALVQDGENKGRDVQRAHIVDRFREDAVQVGFVVILRLKKRPEHGVPLHPNKHFWIRADMPEEKVDRCAEQPLLQRTKTLRVRFSMSRRGLNNVAFLPRPREHTAIYSRRRGGLSGK